MDHRLGESKKDLNEMMNEGILDNIPTFETLGYLDSYVCEPAQIYEDSIHYAPEKFWKNL